MIIVIIIIFYDYSFIKKQLYHSGDEDLFLNLKNYNKTDDYIVKKNDLNITKIEFFKTVEKIQNENI
jgi:hypothetical protein